MIIILTTYLGSYFCGKKRRKTKQCKVILSSNKNTPSNSKESDVVNIITLNLSKIKSNIQLHGFNPIEYAINSYYNYCDCNDYSDLRCPCCGNHSLTYHKVYDRNLTYHYKDKMYNVIIKITVCKCEHCSKIKGKQKYHAILPDFVLPYIIYESSTIMKAILDYYNGVKSKEILERLEIRHKLLYDWIKKLNAYSFSASIVLEINNVIQNIISKIIEYNSVFLNEFYHNYNHPFFLFRLTCVPLCIIP